jgi:hypothetical protein
VIACADGANEYETKKEKKEKREKNLHEASSVPVNGAAQGLQELIPELRALDQVQMEQRLWVSEQPVPNCCLGRRRNRALLGQAETARRSDTRHELALVESQCRALARDQPRAYLK